MNAVVISAATGARELLACARSVQAQTFRRLRHLVVIDGPRFSAPVRRVLRAVRPRRVPLDVLQLPQNTGAGGFVCHRIYAALPHLVDEDVILYLDEDNWFDPDHVAALMAAIRKGKLDWAYSLRKIVDHRGRFFANDDCENLGKWPIWWTIKKRPLYLVDSSCFAVRREVLVQVSWAWHRKGAADRVVTRLLRDNFPRYAGSGRYSLNYRLGNRSVSAVPEFFVEGNAEMAKRYPRGFPWAR